MPTPPVRQDPAAAMRQLKEARAALEAAAVACDDAFRAWMKAPAPARDREALEAAARGFSEAHRRLVHAQAALRQAPSADEPASEKSWGAH